MTNLSHIKQVVTGGPVGCVCPSAKGLVIGAATERTLGTPDSVKFKEKVNGIIEYQKSYQRAVRYVTFFERILFYYDTHAHPESINL